MASQTPSTVSGCLSTGERTLHSSPVALCACTERNMSIDQVPMTGLASPSMSTWCRRKRVQHPGSICIYNTADKAVQAITCLARGRQRPRYIEGMTCVQVQVQPQAYGVGTCGPPRTGQLHSEAGPLPGEHSSLTICAQNQEPCLRPASRKCDQPIHMHQCILGWIWLSLRALRHSAGAEGSCNEGVC